MLAVPFTVQPQQAEDQKDIAALHEAAFGPGRFARTAYRVRESCLLEPDLCLTVRNGVHADGALVGAIHFAPVTIGGQCGALLLGPLAIAPEYVSQGWGMKLIREGLNRGAERGYQLALLVGDLAYYARAGFASIPPGQIRLPGPADPARFLAYELAPGALARYSGLVSGIPLP
jgi:predicted N-acetyltransferase YhbS